MKKILVVLVMMIPTTQLCQPIVIAHRGASGYEPENTLRSFKRAINMGAPMIELDVHRTKSGQMVVIHDPFINNNPQLLVKDLTWTQLQQYDMGQGERIPLLSQVLDLVDKQIVINIELKVDGLAQSVAQLLTQYIQEKKWSPDHFIVSCFDHYQVLAFKNYAPSIKTGVIFDGNPIGLAQIATNAKAEYAIMYYEWITAAFVKDAHKRGVKVFVYTVNDKPLARTVSALGVDGIFSNYPDIMR